MSTSAASAEPGDTQKTSNQRAVRQALRIALAVAAGLVIAVASGAVLPFLAPLFAAQFLVTNRQPMRLGQAIGMIVLIAVTGELLILVSAILGDRPVVTSTLLWLIYFACFLSQARARESSAIFLVLVIAVMIPLLGILQVDLGKSIVLILIEAAATGALLAWLAHALIPETGEEAQKPQAPPAAFATARSALNASILLGIVIWCLVDDRLSTAIVVPITVASLLGQLELAQSRQAAFGLMIVNLLGGITASFAFFFISLRPELPVLFLVGLLIALLFGYAAVSNPRTGKVYAGALTTCLILLGTGISPLPVETPESFTSRIGFVALAIAYTFCATTILWPIIDRKRNNSHR